MVLLYIIVTFFAPSLKLTRAVSIAVFPPPIIITLSPITGFFPLATSCKKSIPPKAPLASSPSIPMDILLCAPIARKIASYPLFLRSLIVKSLPNFLFVYIFGPKSVMDLISMSRTSFGCLYSGIP